MGAAMFASFLPMKGKCNVGSGTVCSATGVIGGICTGLCAVGKFIGLCPGPFCICPDHWALCEKNWMNSK